MINKKIKIKNFIKDFKKYSSTNEFQKDIEDRIKRKEFISKILQKDALHNLDELSFKEIISNLWATAIWSNKEYLVRRIISRNEGLDKIKNELENLLYGNEKFEARFDRFIRKIRGIGPAMITEILCFFNPKEYGIWNDKARKALKILGFETELPLNKYKIKGEEYTKFNSIMKGIAKELEKANFKNADLLLVDCFLYNIWLKLKRKIPIKEEEFDHDEIRDKVKDIGSFLGFEVETEEQIAPGARVDVVWRARIANLGTIAYVFEVHKGGSIDSLILNLQKAMNIPTVQKAVVVSSIDMIEKIKKEMEGTRTEFSRIRFWKVNEVIKAHEHLSEAIKIIEKLQLIER